MSTTAAAGSAPSGRAAPASSASSRSGSEGPRGKKTGSTIRPRMRRRAIPAPRRSQRLEARAAGEAKRLQLVLADATLRDRVEGAFVLAQGEGVVEPDRAERRLPEDAGTNRRADNLLVVHTHALGLDKYAADANAIHDAVDNAVAVQVEGTGALVAKQRSGVGKDGTLQAEVARQAPNRELHLERRADVRGSADGVTAVVQGRDVARTYAGSSEAAHERRPHEEMVRDAQVTAGIVLVFAVARGCAGLGASDADPVLEQLPLVAGGGGGGAELRVAAKARDLGLDLDEEAVARVAEAVERVVRQRQTDERGHCPPRGLLDRRRGLAVRLAEEAVRRAVGTGDSGSGVERRDAREGERAVVVRHLHRVGDLQLRLVQRVAQRHADLFGDRQADAELAADDPVFVAGAPRLVGVLREHVKARGHAVAEEVRLGEREVDATAALAEATRKADKLASSEEVRLRNRELADDAVRSRVAARDRECAGRLVFDLDVDDDAVGRGAGLVRDPDLLEIAEVVETALGAVHQHLVVGIALTDIELAADYVVARPGVAADVDALDVDVRPLLDDVAERDGLGRGVAMTDRAHLRKGVSAAGEISGDFSQRALDGLRVVDVAGRRRDSVAHEARSHAQARIHLHVADAVLGTLLHRHCDDPAARGRVEASVRPDEAEVGVAVLQVVAPDDLLVGGDLLRVVDVGILDEAEEVHLRRVHEVAQARRREHLVADEVDLLDARLAAFDDGEHHVHGAVRQIHEPRRDGGEAAAAAAVELEDAFAVALDSRGVVGRVCLGLQLGQDRRALDARVTLERHPIDHPLGADRRDHSPRCRVLHAHVREEAGRQ